MRLNRLIPLWLLAPGAAGAHGEAAPSQWSAPFAALMVLGLVAAAYLYRWRRTPRATRRDALLFLAGCVALGVALIGPLERWSAGSLAAHMSQHLMLMAVAAPLLVLGLPPRLLRGSLSRRASARARRRRVRLRRIALDVRWLMAAHSLVLVFWHLPQALSAALASGAVHVLMHGSFLAVAMPFWAAVLRGGTRGGAGIGGAALLLFATMTLMALMGAVLTLAPRALYPEYPRLVDQQLAGLIMWVPATLPYFAAGVWLGARRVARAEREAPRA